MFRAALATTLLCAVSTSVAAQERGPRTGWGYSVDGLAIFQGGADLSQGGSFEARRAFLRAAGLYQFDTGVAVGLSLSVGRYNYSFSDVPAQPWSDINDVRISVPIRFSAGQRAQVFLAPSLRFDYENGASVSDGQTYGAFGGIAWRINDRLTLGPAVGIFTEIGDNDIDAFPALLVDWAVTDRLSLTTGTGPGATQGPGLTLSYDVAPGWSVSLAGRYESIRFRLDDTGPAPDGVGQDRSIPVVASVSYAPNPAMSFSAFAGAEFNGDLKLEDTNGTTVSQQTYDTAPIAGLAFRLRF